ncbi:MAG TPA: methyltransferase [Allosphingosinicella sp.]|nr:methyltransferase [Allosphingosinicella sp.]
MPERPADLPPGDAALFDLIDAACESGYHFVTPTPETHRRVLARRDRATDVRDVFGWSLPFEAGLLPTELFRPLEASGMISREDDLMKSLVRISELAGRLFLHSAYPTDAPDSVFLGPDSYRFAAFLQREISALGEVRRLVDIGAGAGVGAVVAASLLPNTRLTLTDVNPLALRFARINAAFAGLDVELVEGEGLSGVSGPVDLVVANPPFIVDPAQRAYRHGGDMHGARLSLDWALEAARRVEPGGTILLYTGSAITDGRDSLRQALEEQLEPLGCSLRYAEIDPDIFGEQIGGPRYEDVERIAAIGAVIRKI